MMVPMLQAPDFIETVQEDLPQLEIRGRGRIPIKSALLVLGHIQVTADAKVRQEPTAILGQSTFWQCATLEC